MSSATNTDDLIIRAPRWPVVVGALVLLGAQIRIEMAVQSLSGVPDRVNELEQTFRAHEVFHAEQAKGIARYYAVTLPKLEEDRTEMKAELAAIREAIDGIRESLRRRDKRR